MTIEAKTALKAELCRLQGIEKAAREFLKSDFGILTVDAVELQAALAVTKKVRNVSATL